MEIHGDFFCLFAFIDYFTTVFCLCYVFKVKPAKDLSHWISVFYLGVIVMGFGNSALWANSFDYLDKNSSDEDFLIYNAIFAMTAVWGPGLGYLFGWLFLRLPFDDIAKHEDKYSRLTDAQYENLQSSPSFIGAYWLGIALIALIQFLAAIPIFGFPRELPNAAEIRKSKEVAYSYGAVESKRTGDSFNDMSFKDVYQGVKHLLTNPVYMSLIIASTASAFFITALAMFGPKLAQALFSVSPKVASLYCAVILFPTSVIAVILSSTLPKLLNFSFKDIFLVCLFGSMVTFLLSFALLFPCSSTNDIDVSDVYIYQGSTCNVTECKCDPLVFKPYCMDERVSLYNPCFYGCVDDNIENCGCFDGDQKKTLVSGNCATKESCSTALFYIFTSVLSVMCFIAFFIYPSITTAIDRVVMPQYRSFGFGIALFMLRLLGTSPAPLVTGLIFDQSCDFKPKMEDSSHSSCVSYSALNQSFGVVAVCCCGFSALVLSLGYSALHFSYSSVADDEKELLVQDKPKKRSIDMGKMLDEIFEN